jgi:adenylate cyclase
MVPVVVLTVGVTVLASLLLAREGLWLYLFLLEASILLAWGLTVASESDRVVSLLSRFVPSFLGKADAQRPGEIRSLEATLLFSDIRGFTTTAEQLEHEDMLGLLNVFHAAVEDTIAKHGGTIVKTPGDAVLAVFWREVKRANHATCALRAAREVLADLPALAKAWEEAGVQLEIGIGVNSGTVAMALVGKHHLEPTVIGDAVNVSQRLESLTKDVPYPLIFSDSVRDQLQDEVEATCLDEVTVKGRQMPIRCYGVGSGPVRRRGAAPAGALRPDGDG